jgi:hypothetical protein
VALASAVNPEFLLAENALDEVVTVPGAVLNLSGVALLPSISNNRGSSNPYRVMSSQFLLRGVHFSKTPNIRLSLAARQVVILGLVMWLDLPLQLFLLFQDLGRTWPQRVATVSSENWSARCENVTSAGTWLVVPNPSWRLCCGFRPWGPHMRHLSCSFQGHSGTLGSEI